MSKRVYVTGLAWASVGVGDDRFFEARTFAAVHFARKTPVGLRLRITRWDCDAVSAFAEEAEFGQGLRVVREWAVVRGEEVFGVAFEVSQGGA